MKLQICVNETGSLICFSKGSSLLGFFKIVLDSFHLISYTLVIRKQTKEFKMEICNAAHAAEVIKAMPVANLRLLIAGLKVQHPQLSNCSDAEIRTFLTRFMWNSK